MLHSSTRTTVMEAMLSRDEIDISNKQSVELVLNFLEKYFPESLGLWQLLKYIQQNLISKDHIWPHQLFVNDQHDIKCVLFIYWSIGFKLNYQLLTEEEKLASRQVRFFCDTKDDHLLMSLIQQYIPWSKIKTIIFCAIQHRFSSLIGNFVRENNLGKYHHESFQQMELDKQAFAEKSEKLTYCCSSDIIIRPLSISDASIVNDLWIYKSTSTLAQITYEIEHFPAFGAYRNEDLISWSLTKYDGSVGTVFTKPEARGLGLGTIINAYVASKIFEQRERAYCYVAYDNVASFKMLEKLGYYRTCNVDWLIFTSE